MELLSLPWLYGSIVFFGLTLINELLLFLIISHKYHVALTLFHCFYIYQVTPWSPCCPFLIPHRSGLSPFDLHPSHIGYRWGLETWYWTYWRKNSEMDPPVWFFNHNNELHLEVILLCGIANSLAMSPKYQRLAPFQSKWVPSKCGQDHLRVTCWIHRNWRATRMGEYPTISFKPIRFLFCSIH